MDAFSSMLNDQMRKYIPKLAPSKDKRRKIWIIREAIAYQKKKQQAWKRYRLTAGRLDYMLTTTEKKTIHYPDKKLV